MRQFDLNIFKRVFSQTTNDFSVGGSRLMSDGSGETNFRAAIFYDSMNGALVNTHNWKVVTNTHFKVSPVVSKSVKIGYLVAGAVVGEVASIKLKGSYGRINETGWIKFSLNIRGFTRGGEGILVSDDVEGEMFFGMYTDADNFVGIINSGTGNPGSFKLITRCAGVETRSSNFTIENEGNPDHLIEILMYLNQVELYEDGALILMNTTNVPNNAELRPYVLTTCVAGGGDDKIDVDYIKVEQ